MNAGLLTPGDTILPTFNIPNVNFEAVAAGVSPTVAAVGTATPIAPYTLGLPTAVGVATVDGLPEQCHPSYTPDLNDLGDLKGQICQFTFPANLLSIARCCDGKAQPQMQGNCTQYCEVSDTQKQFKSCITGLVDTLPKEERPKNWKIKCQNAAKMDRTATAAANGAISVQKGASIMGAMLFSMFFMSYAIM